MSYQFPPLSPCSPLKPLARRTANATVTRLPTHVDDRDTPQIRIAGKWLARLGYLVGDQVQILASRDQIVIFRRKSL